MTALRYHVVVIEDDPQIRRFLRTVLPDEGFEVFEAETGERGLVEAATRKPDVVILDLGLPDIDGVEVIRRLREWSQVPILVLSARTREQDKIAALDAGADDYLDQAVRRGRADGAAAGSAAPRRSARRRRRPSRRSRVGELKVDLAARRVLGRRTRGAAHADRVPAARSAGQACRHGGDTPAAAARRLGAGATSSRHTRCACTWRRSGARSRPTRRSRGISSPRSASATGLPPTDRRGVHGFTPVP